MKPGLRHGLSTAAVAKQPGHRLYVAWCCYDALGAHAHDGEVNPDSYYICANAPGLYIFR